MLRRQALRLRVLIRRSRLDRALAGGDHPATTPLLKLRADQLTRPRLRRRLAGALERVVEEFDADQPWRLTAAIPFRGDQVAEARGHLLSLADALRTEPSVDARGVALVDKLLRDPTSPLYVEGTGPGLRAEAQRALELLVGRREPWRLDGGQHTFAHAGNSDGLG